MARLKNGTPTGFKDSKGIEICVGDSLKGPTGIGYVNGSKVRFKDGRAPSLEALIKNRNEYTVVHLKKLEKPKSEEGHKEPDFIPGQVVANDTGVAFFRDINASGASANVICFWNKSSGVVSVSWVLALKTLRWATEEEEKEFKDALSKAGLSLDKKTMQAIKVEPAFKEGDWVRCGDTFGCVKSWSTNRIVLSWALENNKIVNDLEINDGHLMNESERFDAYRRLTLAGYGFTADWRIMELQYLLSNEVKDKIGSKEITIHEVASLVRASKKEDLHGEVYVKLQF